MALKYIQTQKATLAGSGVTATATSVVLSSLKHLAAVGSTNVVTADLGDICYATFEPGTTREEVISFTGVTQNANGTATLTGVTRNLYPYSPYTQYSATGLAHAGGSYLVISDNPQLFNGLKTYADGLSIAGASDASTTGKGIVELSTAAEINAGTATGGTGAALAVTPDALLSSSYGLYAPSSSQKAFLNATTGMVSLYCGSSTPTGFLDCDGAAVSRATYATLFGVISTAFGAGDGVTTFNVPNFKGATPIGTGQRVKTFTFVDANVNTGTNEITVSSNQYLYHGTPVVLSNSGGALPTGLSATTYYVIRVSATVIKLASSVYNANMGTAVGISAAAGGGTHTLTLTMTTRAVGDEGGKETDTTVGIHDHTITAKDDDTTSGGGGGGSSKPSSTADVSDQGEADPTLTTNMPPFVSVRFIIKT